MIPQILREYFCKQNLKYKLIYAILKVTSHATSNHDFITYYLKTSNGDVIKTSDTNHTIFLLLYLYISNQNK